MNGPAERGEKSWIARATSSLPVPLSPVTSTVASARAIRSTARKISRIAVLRPTIRPSCWRSSTSSRRRSTSRSRSCFSIRLRTLMRSASSSKGFVTKSAAPCFIAWTAAETVLVAVNTITGARTPRWPSSSSSSSPLRPGITRSSSTTSGVAIAISRSAASTSPAIATSPSDFRSMRRDSCTPGSSSTTRMRGIARAYHGAPGPGSGVGRSITISVSGPCVGSIVRRPPSAATIVSASTYSRMWWTGSKSPPIPSARGSR